MSLGILYPTWNLEGAQDAYHMYADPHWWGWSGSTSVFYQWQYRPHLVEAAKVLQRRWRHVGWHVVQLRRAKERSHWSEVSRGHLNWRKSGCGHKHMQVHRPPQRSNARGGKWEFREAFLVDKAKAKTKAEAEMRRADEMLLAAAKSGDEGLVCTLLAKGANLDCVEAQMYDQDYDTPYTPVTELHMPLDLAVTHGHGQIACWILEEASSGTMLRGMHPECVPSGHGPGELLRLCDIGASKLFAAGKTRTLGAQARQIEQRRALAKAVHTLLQSSHVDRAWRRRPYGHYRGELVDARLPGVLMMLGPGRVTVEGLLKLAHWAKHDDLAARLYLAGVRFKFAYGWGDQSRPDVDMARILSWQPGRVHKYETPEHVVRFVARAVVRTLLRRYVRAHLIMWYWREAAERGKYATPDTAGFEEDMVAPVFSEGALGGEAARAS